MVKHWEDLLRDLELMDASYRSRGGKDWQNGLVDSIAPVVHTRVARVLSRHSSVDTGHWARWDVEEITQDVMAMLFADGGRALRGWDRQRGLSFLNFVGLITERTASRILQARNRNAPWLSPETGTAVEDSLRDSRPGPESTLAARQCSRILMARIRELLSRRGSELFDLLLLEARSVEEVCELTGLTREAAYAWRSRLGRLVRRLAREVDLEIPAGAAQSLEVPVEEVSS